MNSLNGHSNPRSDTVQRYEFGPFLVDLASYRITRNGQPLSLTPKAFDTLVVLLQHRNRVVSKDELMSALWPGSFVSEDSLTQSVSVLRRALGDDPSQPRFIATVARQGYRFVAQVQETSIAPEDALAAAPAATAVSSAPASADLSTQDHAPHAQGHTRVREAPVQPAIQSPIKQASIEQPLKQRVAGSVTAAHDVAPASPHAGPAARSAPRLSWTWIATAGAVATLLVLAVVLRRDIMVASGNRAGRGPLRFTQSPPAASRLASGGVLSPDGRYIAFVAQNNRSGRNQMWVRALDESEPRSLTGTEDASRPFWSPDSQVIGFFANGKLKRVDLGTGLPQAITTTASTTEAGGSWGADGLILFTILRSGLYSVQSTGGTVTAVTTLDASAQEIAHRWPQFLPDGRHFLFFIDSVNAQRAGTYLGSLDSPDKTRILDVPATLAPTGFLLYIRDRVLAAQRFDLTRRQLTGEPMAIAGDATPPDVTNGAVISASNDGLLSFSVSKSTEHLEWFGRAGQSLGVIDAPARFRNPSLSPDNRQLLAASNADREHPGLWTIDLERGGLTRLATDGMRPFWSPDGTRIAFTSDRTAGIADIYERSTTSREGEEEAVLRTNENKFICDWSRDGRYLIYGSQSTHTRTDLWLLPLFGDRRPTPFLQTPANEADAQISPDGRWVAYSSDESGAWEVYIESFPVAGHKQGVSVGGGIEPHWRRDGRELFYLAANRNLMAVDVKPGTTWQAGVPRPLFRAPISGLYFYVNRYAVAADGQRFLINTSEGQGRDEPITVLVNWTDRLER